MKCWKYVVYTSLILLAHELVGSRAMATEPAEIQPTDTQVVPLVDWYTDYGFAVRQAMEERKMLVVYFYDPQANALCQQWEQKTLETTPIQDQLKSYVRVKLAMNAEITVNGKQVKLLKHPAFAEMLGKPGLAILDLTNKKSLHYHLVVTVLPFNSGRYASTRATSIVLSLPPGTLTQRTMVFAVRMHPEAPASTEGKLDATLAKEARSHSDHQATIRVQGHHNWDSRFQRINAQLPTGLLAQEVVAESWPNENLVQACEECVHSWRQSPGHWGAVRQRHPIFGFDIKRGLNGIWYATGIFGRR